MKIEIRGCYAGEVADGPNVSRPRTVVTYFRLFRSIRLIVICGMNMAGKRATKGEKA